MKKIFFSLFISSITLVLAQKEDAKMYRASKESKTQLIHTKLKVSFDFAKQQMAGEEWLTATPYFYGSDSLVLDAKAMLIHEIKLGNKALIYKYDKDFIRIKLDKSYKKGEEYTIYIKYTARPEEVKQAGSAAITDAKGLYFIDPLDTDPEKPTQIWTQGETESSSCWFPTIDASNQKTTEEIYITVPSKYVTLSNGKMMNQTNNSDGTRTDYWKQELKHAPYLFFMGVGEFSVVKDKWRNIPVDYYVEKEFEPYAKEIFGLTPEMIEFYSKRLNYDFPWAKYAQIVGRDYVSGAMENTTAVIHQETANQKHGQLIDNNEWEDVIAHELFHHWFGDLVTAESWSNLSVNESFANYSEYLWRENKYGKDHAEALRFKDLEGYFKGDNFNKNLIRFHYADKEDMFDAVSYNKGGYILHMLRSYLGDDAFFAGLNKYLKDNAYGTGEAHQLRLALEAVSGKDLNWYFNQWYYGAGHPKLLVDYVYTDKTVTVKIKQTQEGKAFEFPLAIDIYENGKAKRENVWVKNEAENQFTFNFTKKPEVVIVNANQDILCEITENKTTENYIAQYNSSEYIDRKQAIEALAKVQTTHKEAQNTLIKALKDSYFGLRILALENIDLTQKEIATKALPIIQNLATNDAKTLVQGAAIKALAKTANPASFKTIFEKGVKSESFAVAGNSFSSLYTIDKAAAVKVANEIDPAKTNGDLASSLVKIYIDTKNESKVDFVAKNTADIFLRSFEHPEEKETFKNAYGWIMSNDFPKATETVVADLVKLHEKYGKYGATPAIQAILGQSLKLKQTVTSATAEAQIATIQKAIDKVK